MRILLIAADREQSDWLSDRLAFAGIVARQSASADQALSDRQVEGTAAVLFDSGMSIAQAVPAVRRLRQAGVIQPLIILSGGGDWRDKVECLDAGADDFLLKPVRSEEIAARMRAIIRRGAGQPTDRIQIGAIDLDLKARCAWLSGKCLNLTRNEFRLLRLFMLHPGRVVSHAELLDQLNPGGARPTTNAAEVQIARLRRKVGPELITTIRGVGYCLQAPPGEPEAVPPEREPCRNGCDD